MQHPPAIRPLSTAACTTRATWYLKDYNSRTALEHATSEKKRRVERPDPTSSSSSITTVIIYDELGT
jgi:hypothetical protein